MVAATRNFARDIGTQLAFGFGNKSTAVRGNSSVGTSIITGPVKSFLISAVGAARQIPLFTNFPRVRAPPAARA